MAPLTVPHFIRIAGLFNIAASKWHDMMGGMEDAPTQGSLERDLQERNLLKNPGPTIRAMAFIEGPAWLNQQTDAERIVFERGITEPAAIEDVAGFSVIGALTHLHNLSPEELAEDPHIVYTIYGNGGISRYKVLSDGTVQFARFDARLEPDRIKRACELGFEILD